MHDSLVAFLVSHVTHTTIFGPELDVRKRGYVMLFFAWSSAKGNGKRKRTTDRFDFFNRTVFSPFEYNLTIRTLVKVVFIAWIIIFGTGTILDPPRDILNTEASLS